jgi:hypothetical protein
MLLDSAVTSGDAGSTVERVCPLSAHSIVLLAAG